MIPLIVWHREYRTIYRGPGFLVVVWFDASATPSPPLPSVSCQRQLADERGHWGGGGAKLIRRRKSLVLKFFQYSLVWYLSKINVFVRLCLNPYFRPQANQNGIKNKWVYSEGFDSKLSYSFWRQTTNQNKAFKVFKL